MKKTVDSQKILQILTAAIVIETGLMISSAGTALFYSAELGSSAMATFCDGLHLVLHVSYGDANTIANVALLIALVLLDRSYIGIGTVLCVFTIGPWVNVFMALLEPLNLAAKVMALRILFSFLGAVLMGLGLGLYMAVGKGYGALEGIVSFVCKKYGVNVTTSKVIQDATLVAAGIVLGAQWGVGTLIGIAVTGFVMQRSVQFFSGVLKKHAEWRSEKANV